MFVLHATITAISCGLWCTILAKLLHSHWTKKTDSDLKLFVAYLLSGGNIVDEALLVGLEIPPSSISPLLELIQERILAIHFVVSLGGIFIATMIVVHIMQAVSIAAGKHQRTSPIRSAIFYILFTAIVIINAAFTSQHKLNGFPFIIQDYPAIDIPLLISTFGVLTISVPRTFLSALRSKEIDASPDAKRKDRVQTVLMSSYIMVYSVGVMLRMHFGTTWGFIVLCDAIILCAMVFGFCSTLMYGFGERVAAVMNMHALYIVHFSGQPVFNYVFSRERVPDKEVISPVFFAITQMVESVVHDNKKLHRLVMANDMELIVESGELCIGIIIARKYQPIFAKKLKSMVQRVEKEEYKMLSQWTGANERFNQKMIELMNELF